MSNDHDGQPGAIPDRDGDGKIARQHSDDEIVEAVREHEPATTGEVGETVGMSRQGAGYRLEQLEDDGRITSKSVGPNRVWLPVE